MRGCFIDCCLVDLWLVRDLDCYDGFYGVFGLFVFGVCMCVGDWICGLFVAVWLICCLVFVLAGFLWLCGSSVCFGRQVFGGFGCLCLLLVLLYAFSD